MKVQDLMTTDPETCRPGTNLAAAVEKLWNADCGVLPVIGADATLEGVITDRDICIALGTRNLPASTMVVNSVMKRDVQTCRVDDPIEVALDHMKERRVRRLPVLDGAGKLVGILSLNDVVLAAGSGSKAITPGPVLQTLKAICSHDLPAVINGKANAA